jgi:hypothetical protein
MAPDANEHTPLLGEAEHVRHVNGCAGPGGKDAHAQARRGHGVCQVAVWLRTLLRVHVEKRILFAGFLITLSFSFTQVP